uniref:MGMT family protein n=1 Tax=Ammonifex degensii TaxID=42838 RepID=A0A7C2EIY2_9THEO
MVTQRIELPGGGAFTAVWSERGLWRLLFPETATGPEVRSGGDVPSAWREALANLFAAYFSGMAVDFGGVPVDFAGYTPFQEQVLRFVRGIPYGKVTTYGEVAEGIGRPGAARAAGQVLRRNRTPLVIPCHRVVGRRCPGGFSAGLSWKERLLRLERILP